MARKTDKPAKMGRPTKFTPDLVRRLILALRGGAYIETAAAVVGIHKDTFYEWLRESARHPGAPEWRVEFMDRVVDRTTGEVREVLYAADFTDAVQTAQAESELRDWAIIGSAAETQWQAAAWRLERKFPHRYGRLVRQELSGPGGTPLVPKDEARDQLSALLGAAAARLASEDQNGDGDDDS